MNISKYPFILILVSFLNGCGGTEKAKDTQSVDSKSTVEEIATKNISDSLQSFDYSRKVSGKLFSSTSLIPPEFINSTADILVPLSNETVRGNITVEASRIEDEEGIEKIWLGFSGSDKAQIICEESCSVPFRLFETGVNPFNFGQSPGSIQLQIWVEDQAGNVTVAESRQINWLPSKVILNEVLREEGQLTLRWNQLENAVRYNAYLSDSPIDNIDEFELTGSTQRKLSISTTSQVFEQLEARKNYYGLITGIDGSGESAFSNNILIPASEIITPSAKNDEFEIEQFNELRGNLLENDSDNGLAPIKLLTEAVISPQHGALSLFENGDFIYTPNNNYFGFDSFRYRIVNPQGVIAEASVTIQIKQINSAPIALFNQFIVPANREFTNSENALLLNDIDFDGDDLSINTTPIKDVTNGTLVLLSTGAFTYEPDSDFTGEDSFTYQVEDGKGGVDTAEVTLIVTSEALQPAHVSVNDVFSVDEDVILSIDAPGILNNDLGDNLDSLTVSISKTTANGILELTGSGAFRYIPNENFFGTDYFVYELESNDGVNSSAFVLINISSINDTPLAQTDEVTVSQNQAIEINVLNNDFDIDNEIDTASIQIVDQASHGIASVNSSAGVITYKSNSDFRGQDYFTYVVNDIDGAQSNYATVYVNVTGPNKPPVANNDMAETQQSTPVEIHILDNDVDTDGSIDSSLVKIVTAPENGNASFSIEQNSLLYTPNENFFGTDSLTYSITDNEGAVSTPASVTITVTRVNSTPIAVNDSFQVQQGGESLLNVLQNDSDIDGTINSSSIEIVNTAQFGSLEVLSNGTVLYKNIDQNALSDTFTYQFKDNDGVLSNLATVSIEIIVVDTSPAAVSDSAETFKNQAIAINLLENDDFRGVPLADNPLSIEVQPEHGEVTIVNQAGEISYTPGFNFVGTDTFSYKAFNNKGESSELTEVSILVENKNYAPTIETTTVDITTEVTNDELIAYLIASDPDGDDLNFELLGDFAALFSVNNVGEVRVADLETIITNGSAQYILDTKVCDLIEPPLCAQSTLTVNVEEVLPIEVAAINTDFAQSGIAKINLRASLEHHEVGKAVVLPDGGYLIASGIGHYDETQGRNIHRAAITKVNSFGDIDTQFANEGVFETNLGILIDDLPQNVVAQNLVYDESNKLIYVTGYIDQGASQDLFILRLTESGLLDTSFANDGFFIVVSEMGKRASSVSLFLQSNILFSVINLDNGGLLEGRLIRFDVNANTVTHNKDVTAEIGSELTGAILLPNNQLMVIGNTQNVSENSDIFLSKYNLSDLTLDTDFQTSGYLQIDLAGEDVDNRIKAVTLLDSNQLLISGDHLTQLGDFSTPNRYSLFLAKLDLEGNLDTSFNGVGYHIYSESELPTHSSSEDLLSLSAQGIDLKEIDGAVYVTINREIYSSNYAVQLMKVGLDGVIDNNWNVPFSGVTVYEIDGIRGHGTLSTPSGLVIFGHNHGHVGYNYYASQWLAKINLSGAFESNFGYLGQTTLNSSSSEEWVTSSAKQSNGDILLAGFALNWQNERVPYIYSLDFSGEVNKDFAKQGLSRLNFYSDAVATSLQVNSDDSLFLTGNEGESSAYIAKLTSEGFSDNFYAHGSEASYLSASEFTGEIIRILDLQTLPTQEQLLLTDVHDGCITKSVGVVLSEIGDKVNDFAFEPPAGFECLDTAFKLDEMHLTAAGIFGIGTDAQSYATPRVVVANVDTQGNLVTSFGDSGIAVIDVGTDPGSELTVESYLVDAQGSFYILGIAGGENYIAKLDNLGTLDASFATGGIYKFSNYFDDFVEIKHAFFDSNNRLVIFSQSSMSKVSYISRLLLAESAGTLDLQFNGSGFQALDISTVAELKDVQYHINTDSFLLILQDTINKRISVAAIEITEQ